MPEVVPPAPGVPPVRRVRQSTMLAYGFGASAYGIKDFGFSTLLLFFFNQVLGLPAVQVGLALAAALILDAFIDPLIGSLSDRTRSRWGRRHPWMYAAALPIVASWLLLWNPPELSEGALFVWLFVMAVAVRATVSAYEVPSQALSPELSADYDERTRIMAYRYLFGWLGGMAILMLSYGVFLAPKLGQTNGLLNRDGYIGFSICAAGLMLLAILVSAIGTHNQIPGLLKPEGQGHSIRAHFRELGETIRNRAFVILMGAGLCYYTAQGISFALSNYLYTHAWGFRGSDFQWLGVVLIAGALGAFLVAPRLARRIGKPLAGTIFMVGAAFLLVSPYVLRILGFFPEPGSPALLPVLLSIFAVNALCGISSTILGASMLADVVEQSEIKTGRRAEGVFFAGGFFIQKCTTGVGLLVAGGILSFIHFPENAEAGTVASATIDELTMIFAACYLTLGLGAALLYSRFPFGKAEHEARVEELAGDGVAG